tara:strand:+ start:340 stop:768 length:429 start_codon:yes stop_codon:yes gene_type:complete
MIAQYYSNDIDRVYKIEQEEENSWIKNQFYAYGMDSLESMSYIYLFNSEVIGYLMSKIVLDEVHIHNITVSKEYRNNGVGTDMITYLIDKAKDKNKNKICLEVNNNNLIARKVYNKFRFTKVGVRKKYYNNKNDAVLMDLWI